MKSVILSNESQYHQLASLGLSPKDFCVFSDNSSFYSFLNERGIPFSPLDEFLLKDQWEEINSWACRKASEWIHYCDQKHLFSGIDLASVGYLFLSHLLTQAIKNLLLSREVIKNIQDSEMILFESEIKRSYPYFSGNFYLNFFLKEACLKKGIPHQSIPVREEESLKYFLPVHQPFHKKIGSSMKKYVEWFYGKTLGSPQPGTVVAFGSLKHLGTSLLEMKEKGLGVTLYDYEWHSEQFNFARKHNIPYWIPSLFPGESAPKQIPSLQNQFRVEFLKGLEEASRDQFFVFQDDDLGPFVRDHIFLNADDYWKRLARESQIYERLVSTLQPAGFLLDEDYALKGSFFAAFMKHKGLPVFSISHANLAVDFKIPQDSCFFKHSTTFVQSEFEKSVYVARGWSPDSFEISGIPRFDRIIALKNKPPKAHGSKKIKLLYAATGLWFHNPDQHGYLGCHFTGYGNFQKPGFKLLLDALGDLPIELIVKPHSAEANKSWQQFVHEIAPPNVTVRVMKHSDDFIELLHESDALILCYWSTALIEASLLRKPIFYINPLPFQSPSIDDFSRKGYCKVFTDWKNLRAELGKLCSEGIERYQNTIHFKNPNYYLGDENGKGAKRVAEHIASSLLPKISFSTHLSENKVARCV